MKIEAESPQWKTVSGDNGYWNNSWKERTITTTATQKTKRDSGTKGYRLKKPGFTGYMLENAKIPGSDGIIPITVH